MGGGGGGSIYKFFIILPCFSAIRHGLVYFDSSHSNCSMGNTTGLKCAIDKVSYIPYIQKPAVDGPIGSRNSLG